MAIQLHVVTFHDGRFGPNQTADQNTALIKPNNETEPLAEQQIVETPPLKIAETNLPSGENNLQMPPIDGEDPIQSLSETVLKERAAALEVKQGNDSLARNSHPNREQTPKIPIHSTGTYPLSLQSDEVTPPFNVSPDLAMPNSGDLMQFGSDLLQGGIQWLTNISKSDPLETSNPAVHMDTQPAVDGIDDSIQPVIPMATPTSSASSSTETALPPPVLEDRELDTTPTPQPAVAICSTQVNLLDEKTWKTMPSTCPSWTAEPPQPPLNNIQTLAEEVTSREVLEGGYTLDKTVRTGFQGNLELLKSAASAMTALQTKPSGKTFSVITERGQRKEYYRAQFTMNDLITAGRKLANGCGYEDDVTVSVEKYNEANDLAYACITFRKRMDHAQHTYRALCSAWDIQEEKPLTFASPMGILGSFRADPPRAIQLLEQTRTRVFKDFVGACYERDVPKDLALQAIYRPTPDQRRAFLGNCPEYIASTDCVMFIYKPVPKNHHRARTTESKGHKMAPDTTTGNT